jgi:hypothetical protein
MSVQDGQSDQTRPSAEPTLQQLLGVQVSPMLNQEENTYFSGQEDGIAGSDSEAPPGADVIEDDDEEAAPGASTRDGSPTCAEMIEVSWMSDNAKTVESIINDNSSKPPSATAPLGKNKPRTAQAQRHQSGKDFPRSRQALLLNTATVLSHPQSQLYLRIGRLPPSTHSLLSLLTLSRPPTTPDLHRPLSRGPRLSLRPHTPHPTSQPIKTGELFPAPLASRRCGIRHRSSGSEPTRRSRRPIFFPVVQYRVY